MAFGPSSWTDASRGALRCAAVLQVALLDGTIPIVSMVDVFAGSSIAAPQLQTLTAGPHSAAANLRGGNAVVYWASLEDGAVLSSRTVYAPNTGL